MKYRYSNDTIREYLTKCFHKKVWVCPNIVNNSSISIDPLLTGVECTSSTVPEELLDKKVHVVFNDGDFHCIIWENT